MNIFQSIKMAVKSILGNKKRAILTMLGIVIGIGSVIGITGIIQGVTNNITEEFDSMGANILTVSIRGRSSSNRKVTYAKLKQFEEKNKDIIKAIMPSASGTVTMKYKNSSESSTLEGILSVYEEAKDTHVQEGRFINDLDVSNKRNVALIGSYLKQQYFKTTKALGQNIKINGQIYEVVGVVEEKSTSGKNSIDNKIFIPYTSAVRLLKNANVNSFSIWVDTTENIEKAKTLAETFLYGIYKDEDAYNIIDPKEILNALEKILDMLTAMFAGIAGISLVVGGVGIMNIMLVSVTERTREIGIRKAIGASKKSIMMQFLLEAGLLSSTGGVIGIFLGKSIADVIGKLLDIKSEVTSESVLVAVLFSVGIGMFFGWSPANKAAKLKPIEALRTE